MEFINPLDISKRIKDAATKLEKKNKKQFKEFYKEEFIMSSMVQLVAKDKQVYIYLIEALEFALKKIEEE